MYWKDLSGQFVHDVLLDTSAKNISLYMLPKISICAINIGKIFLANLLTMSCRTPQPKILILTRFQRILSVPYLQERLIWPIY